MNKLSKIFLGIIIILVILLVIMTSLYLKERDLVYEYLGNYNFTYDGNSNNNLDGNFLFSEEGK